MSYGPQKDGLAGRDIRRVGGAFPAEQVFMSTTSPGDDFVERIKAAVASCDVLFALIGPLWLTITNEGGQRPLDSPEDYIRLEIETARKRKIRVIPRLTVSMPS